jgi:hypothetical protein
MRTTQTNQGDWWDLVACVTYGGKRFDDHNMDLLLEANPDLIWFKDLSDNITLNVPPPHERLRAPIVPWA